jgi:hypothetical protein
VFEIVRSPHRQSTARKLSGRLALSALEQNLAAAVPSAQGRLAFIVDVATAAMTEVVAEDVE